MHKIAMKNTKMPVSMENWMMDDGADSIRFTKGQNRTTLGKPANSTSSLFLFGLNQIVPKVTVLPFSSLLLHFELG